MTPEQLRELIRKLRETVSWLEDDAPGSLSIETLSDALSVLKFEVLRLVREGAK